MSFLITLIFVIMCVAFKASIDTILIICMLGWLAWTLEVILDAIKTFVNSFIDTVNRKK